MRDGARKWSVQTFNSRKTVPDTFFSVVQGVRGRGGIHDVMIGAAPFVVTLLTMIVLLILFPAIALWLPGTMA